MRKAKDKSRRFPVRLVNAEEMNAQHPATFHILSREEREAIISGDFVKLCFETADPSRGGERMWVKVCECIHGELFIGTLDNEPVSLPVNIGTWVRFRPEHIVDIDPQ